MIWSPSRQFIERTNVWRFMQRLGFGDREAFLRFSRNEPERFWDELMREMDVEWSTPYRQVMDVSRGPEWARWFIGGKLNIVHNCLDRWAETDRVACISESEDGEARSLTFSELRNEANRAANGFVSHGLQPGDRVAICLPMVPEILPILYGCFKAGLTVVPIFSGYGAGAIAARVADSGALFVVTTEAVQRRGKRLPLADKMPPDVTVLRPDFCRDESPRFQTLALDSEHRALILYTSGTTGQAKGAVHTHAGCLAQTGKEIWLGFDHKPADRFFWLTDIGWMMGPWAIIGNHLFGGNIFLYDGAPDWPTPERIWEMIERHGITTFGISPTAIRLLCRIVHEMPEMASLRILGSTGEPWDEKAWLWFFERVGRRRCPIINISGGTEIIGSFVFPLPIQDLKPCSLGGPAPGMAADVVDESGAPVRGKTGYLVCTQPAPSMTRGLWNAPDRYLETYWSRFRGWWFHGDWATVDADGHWFIHGRADESMNVAGRKVGPAEIEEAMMRHPGVAEAAVIGAPDEVKGEAIIGFVCAKPDVVLDAAAISATVATIMGAAFRPREVIVVPELPKTESGKILRALIRRRYLGEPMLS